MTAPSSDLLLSGLGRNPEIYPHMFDLVGDRVLLANIPLADQMAAVFLDERALTPQTPRAWASWTEVEAAAQSVPMGKLGYIMHAGHCGSTLLSRLVHAAGGARPIREPLPLRVFALDAADNCEGLAFLNPEESRRRISVFERFWAAHGGAVVKATSICCGLIDSVRADAPVIFAYVKPQVFLTLLLGGQNTHLDLRNFAKMRLRRLAAETDLPDPLHRMSPGEIAAMSWLVEASAIAGADRPVRAIDFDDFLARPAEGLMALCRHLGWPAQEAGVAAAVEGPIMRQYAKAPEFSYDASTRATILAEDGRTFAEEIRRGLKWLERASGSFPNGEKALARFGGG